MRVWGFDVGTTSIGFAVIDYDPDRGTGRIERMGVRIFPEGVTEEKGEPRNKERRAKRMMRRQLRRKRWRRRALHEALAGAGLLPGADPAHWPPKLTQTDPYDLRDRGLREKLAPHEVGRALFHMLKRRGFQSARIVTATESDRQKDEEEGVIKAEIDRIASALDGQTVGQWLKAQAKRRGHHTGRSMTEDEFERFWSAQAEHHPGLLTEALKATVHDIAFRQRPIFWRLKTLGECNLEPGEPLCPKGSWRGQRFEMLQTLNNLRLAGGNARPLEPDERQVLLQALETTASLSFAAARTLLKPLWQKSGTPLRTKFNFEVEGGRKLLPGNRLEADLLEIFGSEWPNHPHRDAIRAQIFDRLRDVNYRRLGNKRIEIRGAREVEQERQRFIASVRQDWGITQTQAEKLAAIEPAAAWLHLSETAIDRLMPLLEAGKTYGEARALLYPPPKTEGGGAAKLSSDQRDLPVQRNPTVMRCLNELRKVTNNLLRAHGRPDRIRIELARDVALSGASKRDYLRTIAEREQRRRTAAKRLKENGLAANDRDILKWLLWQECGETCPYTLDRICFEDLFGAHPKFDIEHIWPRSASLDNSFANKTLCRRDVNARKGSRTPFQFFQSNHGIANLPSWEEASSFMRKLVEDRKMPRSKARRFLHEGDVVKSDERLIGDTAYIAREARKWLATLMPRGEHDVETRNGRLVSQLRKLWNLNWLLDPDGEKNRLDHRHHALDAAATALFDTAAMQQIIKWFKHKEENPDLDPPALPLPWPNLHDDLRKALDSIVVSHRVRRKVNGPLHDETRLGLGNEPPVREGGKEYRYYVKRKALAQMSKREIEAIRDQRIRTLAQERLAAFDGDVKKAFATPLMLPGRAGKPDREVVKARIVVKSQPHLVTSLNGGTAYTETSDNHHMAVYRRPDGKIDYQTVSRIEAARRASKKEPIVQRTLPDGSELLFTLTPGTMLEFPNDGRPFYRVVTSVWDAGPVVLVDHTEAGKTVWKRPNASSLVAMGARKVSVDPIGRVRPARD